MRLLLDLGQNRDYGPLWNCLITDVHSDTKQQPHCLLLHTASWSRPLSWPGPTWHFSVPGGIHIIVPVNIPTPYPVSVFGACQVAWRTSILSCSCPRQYFICTKLVIARVEWPASFADLPCPLLMDFQSQGFVMAVHVITACMLGADAHIHTDLGWAQGFVNSTTVSLTQFVSMISLELFGYMALPFLVLWPENWYFSDTCVLHSSVIKLTPGAKQQMRVKK